MDIQPYLDSFPLPANRGILSEINKEKTDKRVKLRASNRVNLTVFNRFLLKVGASSWHRRSEDHNKFEVHCGNSEVGLLVLLVPCDSLDASGCWS